MHFGASHDTPVIVFSVQWVAKNGRSYDLSEIFETDGNLCPFKRIRTILITVIFLRTAVFMTSVITSKLIFQ